MNKHGVQLNLFNVVNREIIVDNFAGGGGASTGIEMAIGRSVDVAINHDPAAIAMHKANHPMTDHYCESVWDVDPRKASGGRPVGLCWLSPDCKHFSKAKGGKPVEKAIRGLAWVAVRWAATVRPRVIMLENVEEFKTWGPLIPQRDSETGRMFKIKRFDNDPNSRIVVSASGEFVKREDRVMIPDPRQKGRTFNCFVNALKRYGYQVEWKELRACDYGAPTIRKRLFLIARCDGNPIIWPTPTHGDPKSVEVKSGRLKPWRTAAGIIDWTIECPSIFERSKPLAENTMRRIARGIVKFVLEEPEPYIVKGFRGMIAPFLAQYHTETAKHEARGQTLDKPILTLDTSNRYGLVSAFLAKHYGGNYTGAGIGMNEPVATITVKDHHALVAAFLTQYNGSSIGQSLKLPLNTISTHDRFGLVTIHGQDYAIVDIGMRMLEPHELFAAQGFPSTYIIDKDADGKQYPKTAQVARCGNSVPPPFAEHLVRANLPELCAEVAAGRKVAQ